MLTLQPAEALLGIASLHDNGSAFPLRESAPGTFGAAGPQTRCARVGQVEPLLEKVDPEQLLQPQRMAASTRLRVVRLDQPDPSRRGLRRAVPSIYSSLSQTTILLPAGWRLAQSFLNLRGAKRADRFNASLFIH
jgi:hypothetical protein